MSSVLAGGIGVFESSLPGFMLRYIYFLNPAARARLTVAEVPFAEIASRSAGRSTGKPIERGKQAAAGDHPERR